GRAPRAGAPAVPRRGRRVRGALRPRDGGAVDGLGGRGGRGAARRERHGGAGGPGAVARRARRGHGGPAPRPPGAGLLRAAALRDGPGHEPGHGRDAGGRGWRRGEGRGGEERGGGR
ncbi:hypothetical protein EG863_15550, partial [Enterococcus faecalis]